jgi:hypothetical protein
MIIPSTIRFSPSRFWRDKAILMSRSLARPQNQKFAVKHKCLSHTGVDTLLGSDCVGRKDLRQLPEPVAENNPWKPVRSKLAEMWLHERVI